jgi:hypothetical protein
MRAAMDSLLMEIGGNCDLTFVVSRPIKRENYKLVATS